MAVYSGHPSVKWVQTGSICLWHSHGCLLSSQSSLTLSLPTFSFLFMQELRAVGISSPGSGRHLFRRPQFLFFPCPNEQGNERAFQESVKENPFILSSGNSWAAIAIREHSDSQATQRPALPPPPLYLLSRVYPRVHGSSRMYPLKLFIILWVQPTASTPLALFLVNTLW